MKKESIQLKVISLIIIIMTITITGVLILTLNNHREDLIQSNETTLSVNTSILNTAIRNIMLSGEAPIATKTLQDLQSLSTLNKVEIYRVDGNTAFSDYETIDSVNSYQSMFQFEKTERIMGDMEDNSNFQMVLKTRTPQVNELVDTRELEYYFPILNYKDCRVCHGDEEFIRGVVHFKISLNSVYNTVRTSTLLTTLLFIAVGFLVVFLLFFALNRVVLSPIRVISYVVNEVGDGKLEEVVELKTQDELGLLGRSINSMITGLKERNRLQIENKVIETQNRESRKYLDNIQEGLVLLDNSNRITSTYSLFFTKLFQIEDPVGLDIGDVIYPQGVPEEFVEFMNMLRDNLLADMDMLMEINPVNNVSVDVGESRVIIDAFFARISGDEDEVENIMVIFKDSTTLIETERRLEEEKKRNQSELEIISVILKSGSDHVNTLYNKLKTLPIGIQELNEANRDETLRDLHTLKGEANYLGFIQLGTVLHQIESDILEDKDKNDIVETLDNEIKLLHSVITNFKEFNSSDNVSESNFFIFLKRLPELVQNLATKLDKDVELTIDNSLNDIRDFETLNGPLIHLIRNSIDHGIEERFERVAKSKTEKGQITIRFSEVDNNYVIEISDDGSGLDFTKIERVARSKGLLNTKEVTHSDLTQVIFKPGFSSQTNVTEISGRGYGLDVVKDVVYKLSGKITVKNYTGKGSSFILSIPIKES